MTSDQRLTPTEHWYGPRSADRSTVGQRKIDDLRRQINAMQNDMKDGSALIHKLNRLQMIEDEKRGREEKVLERNSANNTPRLLHSEMERLYGKDTRLEGNHSPALDKDVINTVMKQRTKEFSRKQQEAALKAKYLDKERQRIQDARRRVEEQRLALGSTPTGKPMFSFHNDKVYMPYQPYHFFDNREERIRDSFVLPINTELPKAKRWKFKIKFVPMPVGNIEAWEKYERQIENEHGPEMDEAVKAFQSCMQTKKSVHRPDYTEVRYVPQFSPEEQVRHYGKSKSRADNYNEYFWRSKIKQLGFDRSVCDFREPLKYAAVHDGYRRADERDLDRRQVKVDTIQNKNDQFYSDKRNQNTLKMDVPRKVKVKFRPSASRGEPYRYRNTSFYRTY